MRFFLLALVVAAAAPSFTIDGVPFVKQDSQYCGPASLASVLGYYGDAADQKAIGEAVYCEKIKGALITDLENFARQRGYRARTGRGTPEDIRDFVARKRPVIVLVDLGFWVVSKPHYLVVFGYNDSGFVAHDGYEAAKLYPYGDFRTIWEKAGSTYLLVHP